MKLDAVSRELLGIAFPSALAVAADPIASLIDTAFIGHLGISIFIYIIQLFMVMGSQIYEKYSDYNIFLEFDSSKF